VSVEQKLVNTVFEAEFNSVNAGYNGSTGMQVAANGQLEAARKALGKYLGISPDCDLFKTALDSARETETLKRMGALCYAK